MDQNSVFDPAQVGELKQKTVWFFSQSHYQAWLENAPLIDHNQPQPAAHIDAPEKPKKKKPISIGKIIVNSVAIIVGILFATVIIQHVYSLIDSNAESVPSETAATQEESASEENSVFKSCELYEALPSGTWKTADGSKQFTTHSDGSISWTDGTETATDSNPLVIRVKLTEENAPNHSRKYDLENYPITEYTYYDLWFYDPSSELLDYDLRIYHPNNTESITQFDCYDKIAETYLTFYLVSDP